MRLLLTGLLAVVLGSSTQPVPRDVVASLDSYLETYEPRLSELIADEVMNQELPAAAVTRAKTYGAIETPRRRRITSEVAFIALPEAGWLGFRHVKAVNGRDVEKSSVPLSSVLQRSAFDAATEMLAASAAHNLGLPRTNNLPNLPLHFLHRSNRTRLLARLDGNEKVRGVATSRVVFAEQTTPTLIRNFATGGDMPSSILAWIDAGGRLMRAEVRTFTSPFAMENAGTVVKVEFAENKTLGLLVPAEMRERFPMVMQDHGTSVATYSNFRKFTTSARIVPQH